MSDQGGAYEPATLKEKLIAVLGQIQVDSGLECPPLTGMTKPVDNIPKFDSKVWPVATTILSTEIGAPIPNDVNIFFDETTKLPRSIDETAVFVCEILREAGGEGRGRGMTDTESAKRAIIAERLKEARKLAGVSQGHVAKILGSASTLHLGNRSRQPPGLGRRTRAPCRNL